MTFTDIQEGTTLKIGVLLLSSPYQTQDMDSMIHFVEAALKKGHEIVGIFL